jgi:hypothetical protein
MLLAIATPSFSFAQQDTASKDTTDKSLEQLMQQLQDSSNTTTTSDPVAQPTTPTEPTHDAAEIKIQNTTYTFQGNEYTLTWTPIQGTSKVEISVKNADTDMDYTKVQTVAASAGTVKINLTSQGTYMVKFTPVDDLSTPLGPDQIMTIKVEAPVKVVEPAKAETVQAAPQVGPAQDLLFGGLILVAILYFVYRFRSNDA